MSFANELSNEIKKADKKTYFNITLVSGKEIELAKLELKDGEDYLTLLSGIDESKFDDDPARYPQGTKIMLSAIASYKVGRLSDD